MSSATPLPPASKSSPSHGPLRFLLGAAALVVIVAGLRAAQSLVVPFLLAAFLAIICGPAVRWLQRKGLPQFFALLVVITAATIAILFVGALVVRSANDFAVRLPALQQTITDKKEHLVAKLVELGVPINDTLNKQVLDIGGITRLFTQLLLGLSSAFSNILLVLLLLIFILLQASTYPNKLLAISGGSPETLRRARLIQEAIMNYSTIKAAVSLLTAAAVTVLTWALGVGYPLLWGILAFFFNFIPNIGSIIAAVPPVALALIENGLGNAAWVALGYLAINGIVGNAIEPRVMGQGLGLSTLVVFISLVFWGWVLGPIGMLLSVPLTMVVKIALEASDDTRWMAILLSAETGDVSTS
ncbi:MAG: AI-2E family transporter [Pirellulales bacterium]